MRQSPCPDESRRPASLNPGAPPQPHGATRGRGNDGNSFSRSAPRAPELGELMAAPVQRGERAPIGVISIAGSRTRMTTARMQSLVPNLLAMTSDLAATSSASGLFSKTPLGRLEPLRATPGALGLRRVYACGAGLALLRKAFWAGHDRAGQGGRESSPGSASLFAERGLPATLAAVSWVGKIRDCHALAKASGSHIHGTFADRKKRLCSRPPCPTGRRHSALSDSRVRRGTSKPRAAARIGFEVPRRNVRVLLANV